MSGTTTATVSATLTWTVESGMSPEILRTPLCRGLGAIRGGRLCMIKTKGMYNQVHLVKIGLKNK